MCHGVPNTCWKAGILARQREIEGPFGEFPGYYSGGHSYPVIEIDRVSHRKNPIFESVYVGRPWTELDFLQAMTTSAPIFIQLNRMFPEVVAVNALYTHGLVVIVSTKVRYGGFAKSVGMGVLTTPHGLGYAKIVIVVDEDVDPFNLNQVMWAMSVRVNPAGDVVIIPNLAENLLDPAGQPNGMAHKMIIDATTPKAPDRRGDYGEVLDTPEQTDAWRSKLTAADQSPQEVSPRHGKLLRSPICPRCRSSNDEHAKQVARRRCLDRIRLRHVLLYVALDRAGREHRPGQISGGISAQSSGSGEATRRADHSAVATAVR